VEDGLQIASRREVQERYDAYRDSSADQAAEPLQHFQGRHPLTSLVLHMGQIGGKQNDERDDDRDRPDAQQSCREHRLGPRPAARRDPVDDVRALARDDAEQKGVKSQGHECREHQGQRLNVFRSHHRGVAEYQDDPVNHEPGQDGSKSGISRRRGHRRPDGGRTPPHHWSSMGAGEGPVH
jgi:hypothetical protein